MRETGLLIPTESLDMPRTAVISDVDAVYIGGEALGLRAEAHNFSRNDTKEGIAFVRAHEVRVYVTANILVHNGDLPGVEAYFKELKGIGPDALIISGPGVFAVMRKVLPGMGIHVNTQANNTNYGTYLFWHKLGARRVVTVRELSLDEIRKTREHIPEDMETGGFIHGAMCISYSGHCLLSSFSVNRDVSQGACTRPCRQKYSIVEETRPGEYMPVRESKRGTYIFDSRDSCTIGHIPEMMGAGIDSFKIEGRMKTTLYVATVARTYGKAIGDCKKDPQLYKDHMEWYRQGIGEYTHRGFTTGFYFGKPTEDAQIYDNDTYVKNYAYLGTVLEVDGRERCLVQQKNKSYVGDTIKVIKPDGRNLELTIAGMEDEEGNAQDSASHPKQVLWIDLGMDVDLEVYDILYKKEENA